MGHVYTLWFDELPEEEVGAKGWKSCCSEIADLFPPRSATLEMPMSNMPAWRWHKPFSGCPGKIDPSNRP